MTMMVYLANLFTLEIIPANMENDPKYSQQWFDNLRRALMELFDGRYVQSEGTQKWINRAVVGFITVICMSVITSILGLLTGLIHL